MLDCPGTLRFCWRHLAKAGMSPNTSFIHCRMRLGTCAGEYGAAPRAENAASAAAAATDGDHVHAAAGTPHDPSPDKGKSALPTVTQAPHYPQQSSLQCTLFDSSSYFSVKQHVHFCFHLSEVSCFYAFTDRVASWTSRHLLEDTLWPTKTIYDSLSLPLEVISAHACT